MSPDDSSPNQEKLEALHRVIQTAASKSSRLAMMALAVGSLVVFLPGGTLHPSVYAALTGLGFEAFGSLLDRIAYGNDLSNEELLRAIQEILDEERFQDLLTTKEFQRSLARVFERNERHVELALKSVEATTRNELQRLLDEYHTDLQEDLREQFQELIKVSSHWRLEPNSDALELFSSPPIPKRFVNREARLEQLKRLITDGEKTIIWIGEIKGIGKTYLASQFYRMVKASQERQAFWVDCRSRHVTVEELLVALANASKKPELLEFVNDPANRLSTPLNK